MTADDVVDAMYRSMNFEVGERPDFERHAVIFARSARLVRVNDDGVFEFDPQSFRQNLEAMIDSGALPSFYENEIWRQTLQFGDVAHVLTSYEMRASRAGELVATAIKSIQLYRKDEQWLISAMLWRRAGRDVPASSFRRPNDSL